MVYSAAWTILFSPASSANTLAMCLKHASADASAAAADSRTGAAGSAGGKRAAKPPAHRGSEAVRRDEEDIYECERYGGPPGAVAKKWGKGNAA